MSRTPSPLAQTSNYQELLEKAKSSRPAIILTRTPTKNGRSLIKATQSPRKRNYSATENLSTETATPTANQLLLLPNKLNFTPTRFFRCHAKNQARDDTKTQIWSCAFAPDAENPIENLPLVATCGGDSFCIIDTEQVQVVKKYTTKEEAETFYCLAWFTLPLDNLGLSHVNYLVAAGTSGHLYLSHPEGNAVFEKFLATPSGVAIHSLIAHPSQPGTIICGTVDGRIIAWNIGSPRPPSYSTNPVIVFDLRIPPGGGVDNMLYWPDCDILLGAGENGLFAFRNFHVKQHDVVRLRFFQKSQSKTIDSLIKVNPALAAAKQVYTGKIILFSIDQIDFELSNPKPSKSKGCAVLDVQPLAELDWSGTDNFYINMGIQLSGNLLACGDDKGTIWLYDLSEFDPETPCNIKPSQMIYWPQKLKDSNLTAYQQSKLSKIDIVINRVAVSSDGRTLVTVTSNNLVGIYKLNLK